MAKAKKTEEPLTPDQLKQQLVDKAKADGHISQQDIFAVIAETPENAEVLDALYTELADASVEITVAEEPTAADVEWVAEEDEEDEVKAVEGVYLDDDVADDSVRL